MKKNKHIFWLGALFFVFALIKYAFNAELLSAGFIVFEILSFLVVLYMVYFVLNLVDACLDSSSAPNADKECVKRQNEINRLKAKLKNLSEAGDGEGDSERIDNELLLDQLKKAYKGYDKESAGKLVDVLTKQYEVMAAIGYCANADIYNVVKRYGIEEEIVLPDLVLEDGLHAQAIADRKPMELTDVPADYIEVGSGTGASKPVYLYILPLIKDERNGLVLELATFKKNDLIEIWNQFLSVQ